MLTMIILLAVAVFYFRVLGFGLRVFGRIIGWLIGMAIVFSIIGGMFGLLGAVAGITVKILPAAILLGIGILIGRSLSGQSSARRDFRYRAQDAIDRCRTHAQDFCNGFRNYEQDIIDANDRVIR